MGPMPGGCAGGSIVQTHEVHQLLPEGTRLQQGRSCGVYPLWYGVPGGSAMLPGVVACAKRVAYSLTIHNSPLRCRTRIRGSTCRWAQGRSGRILAGTASPGFHVDFDILKWFDMIWHLTWVYHVIHTDDTETSSSGLFGVVRALIGPR